jgi:integrating conjugative element protein (TIGR03761 family)
MNKSTAAKVTPQIKPKKNPIPFKVIASLKLYTEIANELFNASWHLGNIGLMQFSFQIEKIYRASQADDPYADWFLMKTYDALFTAKERLNKINQKISFYFGTQPSIELKFTATKPKIKKIRIVNPYSYMGACLLTDLDQILRQFIILRHIGTHIVNDMTIKLPIKELQTAFSIPLSWKDTKVTRQDIRKNNEKSQKAKSAFKHPLPNEVLNQEIDFSYFPKAKKSDYK